MSQSPIDAVLARLAQLSGRQSSRCGDGWKAVCPGHKGGKEEDPSLSVREGTDGRVLLNCFAAGCSFDAVVAGLGMEPTDLFPKLNGASGRQDGGVQLGSAASLAAARVTVESFAAHVQLPAGFLRGLGVEDYRRGASIPFMDEAGRLLFRKIRCHLTDKKLKYQYEVRGTHVAPYGLWRLPAVRAGENKALVLVEGETDAMTLWHHSVQALGLPGATTSACLAAEHVAGIGTLYVVQEPGAAGELYADAVARRLVELSWPGTAWLLRMQLEAKDPNEMHKTEPRTFRARFADLCARALPLDAPRIEDCFLTLSEVEEEPLSFLWYPYVITGELNVVMGAPGEGKGQATIAVAAAVTTGEPFPGEAEGRDPADVLIFAPEDNLRKIIKKRFRLAGGDPARAHAFNFKGGHTFSFSADDQLRLRAAIDRFRPGLVLFDPVAAFTGDRADTMNKAELVCAMLRPMAQIFEEAATNALLVAHTKKGQVSRALEALSGNTQFGAIVRSVVGVYPDPKHRSTARASHGLWTHVKHNNSAGGESLRFSIVNGEDNFGRFAWGEASETSAQDLVGGGAAGRPGAVSAAGPEGAAATERAVEFLRDVFRGCYELPAGDVQRLTREAAISQAAMDRARQRLGMAYRRDGAGAGSKIYWRLGGEAMEGGTVSEGAVEDTDGETACPEKPPF